MSIRRFAQVHRGVQVLGIVTLIAAWVATGCNSVTPGSGPANADKDASLADQKRGGIKPPHPGGGGDPTGTNEAPVADAGGSFQVDAGTWVVLDGSGSSDADGDALSFQWQQKGNRHDRVELQDADSALASFVAPMVSSQKTLRFTLTVSDGTTTASDSANVLVRPLGAGDPPVELVIVASADTGYVPLLVDFAVVTADGRPLPDGVYTWDFGDGYTYQGQSAQHEFTWSSTFSVSVCVANQDGSASGVDCAGTSIVAMDPGGGGDPGNDRTADQPDSWLVLYNLNEADSVAWVDWYIQQWGIPSENTLGLNVDAYSEKIYRDDYVTGIYDPVTQYLAANPELAGRIMGILVGYRVPGTFIVGPNSPVYQGGGGWSVANRLQNLDPAHLYDGRGPANPHFFDCCPTPAPQRLTKATLVPYIYLTARIDAPTLAQAQALTQRAQAISNASEPLSVDEVIYHDYLDPGAPAGGEWLALRRATENLQLDHPVYAFPWQHFESDGSSEEEITNAALRFSYYKLTGWQNALWGNPASGSRILGFAMNSWGGTTVRSTTDHNGRYVPNALFSGGFAGAVGATAEPFVSTVPDPGTMVWCLAAGRTLGEAVFHGNRYAGWMWELVGDPLLVVPQWFEY